MRAVRIALLLLATSCSAVPSAPTATTHAETAAAVPSVAPTISSPVATSAVPAATSPTPTVGADRVRYANTVLGYSVDLPRGWRRATCSQGVSSVSPLQSGELFVGVPEDEEVIAAGAPLLAVRVIDSGSATPLAWLERNATDPDARTEATTLGARTGARGFIGSSGQTYAYAFAARGWIYAIDVASFSLDDKELAETLPTFRILDDATLGRDVAATPAPRSIDSVAVSAAEAFNANDPAAVARVLSPCVTVGGVPGDGVHESSARFIKELGARLGSGTSIRVASNAIETDPYMGRFLRSSWTTSGEADQRVDLFLSQQDGRWSVSAVLVRGLPN